MSRDPHVPIDCLPAGDDDVDVAELLDRGGEHEAGLIPVQVLEERVGEEDAFVGAHGQTVLDGVAGALRAHAHDGDFGVRGLVLNAHGGLDADGIEL
jgi:hypothetical protein